MADVRELPPFPSTKSSFLKTFFNGLNTLSGIGILTLPYTLSQGGWLSISVLFAMAIITCFTGLLLKRCMDSNQQINTYPDIGYYAFGRKGRIIISSLTYLELYIIPTEFLILEGDNLHKLFPKVLYICFGISTLTNALMGILGYSMFGKNADSQVTLNLPTHKLSSKIAIYTTLTIPLSKYALIMTPVAEAIKTRLPNHYQIKPVFTLVRTLLLLSSVIVAIGFPYFVYLASLTAAILVVATSIVFPCICYVKILKVHEHRSFGFATIIGIIVLALFIDVTGTFYSVKEVVRQT